MRLTALGREVVQILTVARPTSPNRNREPFSATYHIVVLRTSHGTVSVGLLSTRKKDSHRE